MARRASTRGKARSNEGGFPSWGYYALGGLAIAGIIYALSKYGPTSETISGWIDSANDFIGGDDDTDEFADDMQADDFGDASSAVDQGGYNAGGRQQSY